jgi:uracil-DNA glycosylase
MNKIVFIGEAWGEQEVQYEFPFVGTAGQELFRLLHKTHHVPTGLDYKYCSPLRMMNLWLSSGITLLNVFNARPGKESNDVQLFYAHYRDNVPLDKSLPARRFGAANYHVRAAFSGHIYALRNKLLELKPNLIVPLGATACWALGLGEGIGRLRGFVHDTEYGKVLPTYHPAAVLRSWNLRVPVLFDLTKAHRECQFPEIRHPSRTIWTEPTPAECCQWWEERGRTAPLLALDIETIPALGQITEVGFASDPYHALHIPIAIDGKSFYSHRDEVAVWKFIKHACESEVPKIGQHLKYDIYWLWKELGIAVRNWQHDTMIASHAWQPELQKSLYELGSMWLDERSWKSIRQDSSKMTKDFE